MVARKRESTDAKNFWMSSIGLVRHLMDLSVFLTLSPDLVEDPYYRREVEYVRDNLTDAEEKELTLKSNWQLEAIFFSFFYHYWAHPWGRIILHQGKFAFSKNKIADLTPSPIPYFLLPCECIHCQVPFLAKGDYDAAGKATFYCGRCPANSKERFNKLKANINRALERFSNQRDSVSKREMFGELMAAYEMLWRYIHKPYTPRYKLMETFEQVPVDWLLDLYGGRLPDLARLKLVGKEVDVPLFPENLYDMTVTNDYYSKLERRKLKKNREHIIARKVYEIDGLTVPWQLTLELLNFWVDPQLSPNEVMLSD